MHIKTYQNTLYHLQRLKKLSANQNSSIVLNNIEKEFNIITKLVNKQDIYRDCSWDSIKKFHEMMCQTCLTHFCNCPLDINANNINTIQQQFKNFVTEQSINDDIGTKIIHTTQNSAFFPTRFNDLYSQAIKYRNHISHSHENQQNLSDLYFHIFILYTCFSILHDKFS